MSRINYINPEKFVLLTEAGVVPTIPDPPTLRRSNSGFLDTDLELGEWARNVTDRKLYFRSSTGIQTYNDDLFGSFVLVGTTGTPISLGDLFELKGETPNQYIECKFPFACLYEVMAWSNAGQFPPSIWASMPDGSSTIKGGIMYDEAIFEKNLSGQLTIKEGVISPGDHTHDDKADLVNGLVPASQLPSYVDDVLEYASTAAFPGTGESAKIYVAVNTNLTYRWTGTGYAEISQSLALGETSSTAYRGDRGKIAYDHSQSAHIPFVNPILTNVTLGGNLGAPASSGSIRVGMIRIGIDPSWAGTELNAGIFNDDTIGYAAWFQAQCPGNYGINRPLWLNPNGGDVKFGANINAIGEVTAFYSSDRRLKKDITSFSALDIVDRLRPIKYHYNDLGLSLCSGKDDRWYYSFVAQEMEKVLPELIHPIYDKYKGIDQNQMSAILTQAIKEMRNEIKEIRQWQR